MNSQKTVYTTILSSRLTISLLITSILLLTACQEESATNIFDEANQNDSLTAVSHLLEELIDKQADACTFSETTEILRDVSGKLVFTNSVSGIRIAEASYFILLDSPSLPLELCNVNREYAILPDSIDLDSIHITFNGRAQVYPAEVDALSRPVQVTYAELYVHDSIHR